MGSQIVTSLRQDQYRNREYAFNNFYKNLTFL